jgi:hypothetical protein
MMGNAPIHVPPLYGTASGPALVLGWMNDKHYTSTQLRRRRSNRAPQVLEGGSAVGARDASRADGAKDACVDSSTAQGARRSKSALAGGVGIPTASQQDGPAGNADSLPSHLQQMDVNDSLPQDANESDAGQARPTAQTRHMNRSSWSR